MRELRHLALREAMRERQFWGVLVTTITNHRDDRTTWSTCTCGWTSSPNSSHDLVHQAEAHRRWCQNRNGETR